MEIIVPFFFVLRVLLAFVSPAAKITSLPRLSETFLLECLRREPKGGNDRGVHVEVHAGTCVRIYRAGLDRISSFTV